MAQTFESLSKYPGLDHDDVKKALEGAIGVVREDLGKFTDFFPSSNSFDGFYEQTDNVEWTTGFWTGVLWLAYENTDDGCFKEAALKQVDSFLNRIENKIDVNHHDMGFLYTPSCVAAWKLTGNRTGREAAIKAADKLISRFHEKGEFIQAWGAMNAPENYRLIIDCLLNLPLLYWASEETGDSKYRI